MSKRVLFFDTETTGLVNFRRPADDPSQPHLVQLGAVLRDTDGAHVAVMSRLVRPEGYAIPEEATRVHGFTTERAAEFGRDLEDVLWDFLLMAEEAGLVVCHNASFDLLVMQAACYRAGIPNPLQDRPAFCTMRAATGIMKLPGPYGYKWPKLEEALRYFCGLEIEGAHDALNDVRATMRVFDALVTGDTLPAAGFVRA